MLAHGLVSPLACRTYGRGFGVTMAILMMRMSHFVQCHFVVVVVDYVFSVDDGCHDHVVMYSRRKHIHSCGHYLTCEINGACVMRDLNVVMCHVRS